MKGEAMTMQRVINKENSKNMLILFSLAFVSLLFLRDSLSVSVSKYVFIIIYMIATVALNIQDNISLFCLLMPLYVGLPGNYITIIFMVRLLTAKEYNLKINETFFLSMVVLIIYIVLREVNVIFSSIFYTMHILEIVLLFLLTLKIKSCDVTQMCIMYVCGVAAMGTIMLVSTLNAYSLMEILTSTARLGTAASAYNESGQMGVRVDPNYYGLFAIAAISISVHFVLKRKLTTAKKLLLIICSGISFTVAIIGLSRSFLLVLILWLFVYFLSQKNIQTMLRMASIVCIAIVLFFLMIPEAVEALSSRFNSSDMATANGRVNLISEGMTAWKQGIGTILFGTGFFKCTIHCMPLQFLFGGGGVMAILVAVYYILLFKQVTEKRHFKFQEYLPLYSALIMSLSVPIAQSLTFMFPIIITFFAISSNASLIERGSKPN